VSMQVRVRFVAPPATGLEAAGVKLPHSALEVPGSLTRAGLARVANHLIDSAARAAGLDEAVAKGLQLDWDVLCGGTLMRGKLLKHLRSLGEGEGVFEQVVEVALVRPVPAPSSTSSRRAPDWVGGVGASEGVVLSGSMDGSVMLHSVDPASAVLSDSPLCAFLGHAGAVRSVALESGPALHRGTLAAGVTGGKDGVARLWRLRLEGGDPVECAGVMSAHEASVSACAWGQGLERVASADWSGVLCVWDSSSVCDAGWSAEEEAPRAAGSSRSKRARVTVKEPPCIAPLLVESAHSDAVGGLVWSDSSRVVSGSWDRTLKVWDASRLGPDPVSILSCSKPCTGVASAAAVSMSSDVLASSHSDGLVRVWDARAGGSASSAIRLSGHTAWATGVAWRPMHSHHVASCAHDGKVALWDVRAAGEPLHWVDSANDSAKLLSLAWSSPQVLCAGGEDRRVRAALIAN
jgi:ribosome biogenesis protein